jgi:predicted HD phosphohydrolase
MIAVQTTIGNGPRFRSSSEDLYQFLEGGFHHPNRSIRKRFLQSAAAAAQGVSENGCVHSIVATLFSGCSEMFVLGCYFDNDASVDSLLETQAYDWLVIQFGTEVAELVRLQFSARRYLATVVPRYFPRLDLTQQKEVFGGGGFMNSFEKQAFMESPFYSRALAIARWRDQDVRGRLEIPDVEFFTVFIELCMERRGV